MTIDQQIDKQIHKKRITAIDLGTNSFHAIIVDICADGSYQTVDTLKEMVGLGKEITHGKLSQRAMNRGIDVLRKIRILSDNQGSEKIIAYATSAIRESKNGGVFIQRAIDELQIKIHAIPGKTEAELISLAVKNAISIGEEPVLMMDIGGGSVEFVVGNQNKNFDLISRKIGGSRTGSRFIRHDPVIKSEIKKMRIFFEQELESVKEAVAKEPVTTLIGSSGTMENIGSIIAHKKGIDTSVTLNEYEFSARDFRSIYRNMIGMNRKERLNVNGLDPKRVDYIIPGMILLDVVIKNFNIKKIKTSTDALREGMILRYIKQDMKELRLLANHPDPRERSVFELLRKCNWHEKHSRQVAKLGLRLFDQTREEHDLTDNDRELLRFACYMHDIGYHISHRKHHKHALYLIQNADLKGFTQEEIQIMAHVSRYHRRSIPHKRHSEYNALPQKTKRKIIKLSAFMRVADGLDRSHYQNVKKLNVDIQKKNIILHIHALNDPELEIWGTMRKRELFERLFKRKLKIEVDNKEDFEVETVSLAQS